MLVPDNSCGGFLIKHFEIGDLPLEDLEGLVKVFLSFNSLADLENWLQERLRSNFE